MIATLRALEPHQLPDFVSRLKADVLKRVVEKIPHLESSMAVAELTTALHYVLNTPDDVLVWDVGHQGYIHKAITGRLEQLSTQRKKGGISGFLKREESPFDFFGAGHASTSLSALTGACLADAAAGRERNRVAVIGDGSLTGGQAFEALNHLGSLNTNALVVINDNDGSIDPTVGALHKRGSYKTFVESLGWSYTFVSDGHDVVELVRVLSTMLGAKGLQVLHLKTKRPDLSPPKSYTPGTTFQWWASEAMRPLMEANKDIQVLSPAMFASSGFGPLRDEYPDRFFDTGINEPHTVTTAAAIAAAGGKPWVHVYSTFLQRAIDAVLHDVALQQLPVVFLVDRAGIVGADGPTHHGVFDLGMLMDVPGATVWNPRNGAELQAMLAQAARIQGELNGPLFLRYPKAKTDVEPQEVFASMRWMVEHGSNTLLVSTGALSDFATDGAWDHLHLGQVKPLPEGFSEAVRRYENIIVLEEGSGEGGLFGAVARLAAEEDAVVRLVQRKIGNGFVDHGERDELLREIGLIP